MDLFLSALQREAKRMQKNDVRLRVIGDRVGFSEKLQARIAAAEELTAGNGGLLLQIAANYGGRWDIVEATRKIAEQVASGTLEPASISEHSVSEALSFPGVADPDLYIRTGGERRLSNFLLWQAAYSELYFTSTLWPDFDAAAFDLALTDYAGRQRRFGLTSEQLPASSSVDG
jgi:undecaprenyl diphosphate synthase